MIRSWGFSKLKTLILRADNFQRLTDMALPGPFFNQGKFLLARFQ